MAVREERYGGKEEDAVKCERPDQAPEHVEVCNDAEAELGDWSLVRDQITNRVLLLTLLLLGDFLAVDHHGLLLILGVVLSLLKKIAVDGGGALLLVASDGAKPLEGLTEGRLLERVKLFEKLVSILDLCVIKRLELRYNVRCDAETVGVLIAAVCVLEVVVFVFVVYHYEVKFQQYFESFN